jgi:hypothetical protein
MGVRMQRQKPEGFNSLVLLIHVEVLEIRGLEEAKVDAAVVGSSLQEGSQVSA